jgi:tetratricopeptide (TPR) repeat protein
MCTTPSNVEIYPVRQLEIYRWGDHLGLAVKAVSEGGVGRPHLAATLASYKEAECTHAETLARDVVTQNNLGVALSLLGKIDGHREPLLEALDAFRTALSLIAPSDQKWAITQNSLADALRSLALLEPGVERCQEAVAAYRVTLDAIEAERSTLWARACCGLADALRLVAERKQSPDGLDEARQLLAQALPIFEEADKGEMPFIKPAYSNREYPRLQTGSGRRCSRHCSADYRESLNHRVIIAKGAAVA